MQDLALVLGPAAADALSRTADTVLPSELARDFLLVYARLGTATMLLPGLGELWVPARVRLILGLALSFVVLPALLDHLPPLPGSAAEAAAQIGLEVLIGGFLGFCIRATTASMAVAGSLVASQSGLANALTPGIVSPDATTTLASFLGLAAIAFLVNTGLDHMILHGVVESYAVLPPPGRIPTLPPVDQLVQTVMRIVADGFALGLWVSFPFLVAMLLLNLGLGLANRFMPSLQVYFLATPVAILLVLGLLAWAAPAMLQALGAALETTLTRLGGG
ncbi:flagellar biosynthetic protein FliR [Benzoatithermus flavus]|uniref:Flagellar biosynthetic protein FliR n=1 Tax=Benzoatithermus flavus TaxID=3108223 RepID=A0ABU8XVB2_9PROT